MFLICINLFQVLAPETNQLVSQIINICVSMTSVVDFYSRTYIHGSTGTLQKKLTGTYFLAKIYSVDQPKADWSAIDSPKK